MVVDSVLNDLHELNQLRHEFKAAILVTSDPDEKWRLHGTLRELEDCIDRLQGLQVG